MTPPGPITALVGSTLVAATHNAGKFRELDDLFRPLDIELLSAADLGVVEPEETGSTFAANAALKAQHASTVSGLSAIADDSGLCVDALFGDPGIFSARWAGPRRDFAEATNRIENALRAAGATDLSARFVCVLALARPGAPTRIFEGVVRGSLVFPGRGDRGFGYDPIFVPDGHRATFGEMEPRTKHAISHRAAAMRKLVAYRK